MGGDSDHGEDLGMKGPGFCPSLAVGSQAIYLISIIYIPHL